MKEIRSIASDSYPISQNNLRSTSKIPFTSKKIAEFPSTQTETQFLDTHSLLQKESGYENNLSLATRKKHHCLKMITPWMKKIGINFDVTQINLWYTIGVNVSPKNRGKHMKPFR